MRVWHLFALSVLLSGCSSGGADKLLVGLKDEILGVEKPPQSRAILTRAQIDKLGVAMLRASVPVTGQRFVAIAGQERAGNVTYIGPDQKTVVLRGGLVVGVHGVGFAFLAPASQNDPVVNARKLQSWPDKISRTYMLDGRGPSGRRLDVICAVTIGPQQSIEIVEQIYKVNAVVENCTDGDGVSFANTHFVNPNSGFIWQSSQWTGPQQGALVYEILEPLE